MSLLERSRPPAGRMAPVRRQVDSPLRVALIASSRFPIRQPFAGGLEAHVWQLSRALTARGHEVSVFAGEGSDDAVATYAFPASRWTPSAAAQQDVSMPAGDWLAEHHAYLRLMLALAGELRDRFDVVHNHSLHHLPVAMAPMIDTPLLTTLHTPPTPWLESAVAAAGTTAGLRFAAVSGFTADSWDVLERRPDVVLNGVDLEAFPRGSGGRDLVWSGRLVPEKGPHLAIDAARRAGMRIRLAGPVSDPGYFAREIAPRLGPDAVHLGHLGHAELASLVGASAAALVTPVWNEPYGLVVAEALACGTPVVAFARGGIPEVLGSRTCGRLVPAGDVDALAAAIPEAVALPRGPVRAHAARWCSNGRMVDDYLDLYGAMRAERADPRAAAAPRRAPAVA